MNIGRLGGPALRFAICRRLVVRLDVEPQIGDHSPNLRGRLPGRGQIAVDEHGVGRIEGERLKAAQVVFASGGNPDFGFRV